jgi:acyl-CoA thioesterase
VDARTFLGLEAAGRLHWRLPVRTSLTTGGGFLFGGVGLAAGIEALEAATGRPLIWATAQYLSYALPPSTVDLAVTVVVSGRQTAQARVVGTVDAQEIFTVNAALGSRPLDASGAWAVRPDVAPPPRARPRRASTATRARS